MGFLSGLFRTTPSGDFDELASGIVTRMTQSDRIAPLGDLWAFRAAFDGMQATKLEPMTLEKIEELLEKERYVEVIAQARELISRQPSAMSQAQTLIGSAHLGLRFYRMAVRDFVSGARFEQYFETVVKNLNAVHVALHARPTCKLSRLVLGVLATDSFDATIHERAVSKEVVAALLSRGEVARRLGAPHLALQDFARALALEDHPSTRAMIVLAAAELEDVDAEALAPRARESSAYRELDKRLAPVLPRWEATARDEWSDVITRIEALE